MTFEKMFQKIKHICEDRIIMYTQSKSVEIPGSYPEDMANAKIWAYKDILNNITSLEKEKTTSARSSYYFNHKIYPTHRRKG